MCKTKILIRFPCKEQKSSRIGPKIHNSIVVEKEKETKNTC
jgi:hypothetical protein